MKKKEDLDTLLNSTQHWPCLGQTYQSMRPLITASENRPSSLTYFRRFAAGNDSATTSVLICLLLLFGIAGFPQITVF